MHFLSQQWKPTTNTSILIPGTAIPINLIFLGLPNMGKIIFLLILLSDLFIILLTMIYFLLASLVVEDIVD